MKITYAIGDVHGHLDEFKKILELIKKDMAEQPKDLKFRVIQMGDLIDRGPHSKEVVEICMDLQSQFPNAEVHILMGNHEEAMINIYNGQTENLKNWLLLKRGKGGGIKTMRSYGHKPGLDMGKLDKIIKEIQEIIPKEHIEFFTNLPASVEDDTYLFVHSGVIPGVLLKDQKNEDLIDLEGDKRVNFITGTNSYEKIIVHAHTPHPDGEILPNRVNTDAGVALNMHLQCTILPEKYEMEKVRILKVKVEGPKREWIPHENYQKRFKTEEEPD